VKVRRILASFALVSSFVVPVFAQTAPAAAPAAAPAPPPPLWTGSIGAGIAVTSGNSDTSNVNLSFKAVRDPKTKVVFSTEGLWMRGTGNGELTADNLTFGAKVSRQLSDRTYFFGQFQYLRDSFKAIDYFVAPTFGVGVKLVDTEKAKFSTDIAVGPSWEKNPDLDVRSKVAIVFGQKSSYAFSKTAVLTQGFNAALVADDFADGLYTFNVGIAASMTTRTQLKFEILDTFKNKPPTADIKKNDVSTLVSVIYKF
jgi:putative salt-induced outer membrane protein YdiY